VEITKVDIFQVDFPENPIWKPILCRVYTDEGIYGDGEGAMAYGVASTGTFGMLQRLICSHISLLLKRRRLWMQKLGSESVDGHDFIYEQICKGNAEKAQKLMEQMLDVIPPEGQLE